MVDSRRRPHRARARHERLGEPAVRTARHGDQASRPLDGPRRGRTLSPEPESDVPGNGRAAERRRDLSGQHCAVDRDSDLHRRHPAAVHPLRGEQDGGRVRPGVCGVSEPGATVAVMSDAGRHWEAIYQARKPDEFSWYRPHLDRSLRFIEGAGLPKSAAILDVGGGASTLVDDLVTRGYENVTVLDLSVRAIEEARARLGLRGASVTWLVGDITEITLPEHHYDFWHDRAVFH